MSIATLPVPSFQERSGIFRPSRYDFFVIWGNGLQHADAILQTLRAERDLTILRIESRQLCNVRKFVFNLYSCDTVPISHLRAKLTYLFDERPEILIVFVKNHAPMETYCGEGRFRHLQCAYINSLKQGIRDQYNPHEDGRRTERHVIHASDCEEQVDHFLRLLGYPQGISFLHDTEPGLPFKKPYYIPKPETYTFKILPIAELRAFILSGFPEVTTEPRDIEATPHFQCLHGDSEAYRNYLLQYRYTWLHEDYSVERLLQLCHMPQSQREALGPVIVTSTPGGYRLLDGVHRTSVALFHGCEHIRCVEVEGCG